MTNPVLDHITRTPLPWQRPVEQLTECGKRVVDIASAITWEAYVAKVKDQGVARAALSSCMTCTQRGQYRKIHDWASSPSGALARAIEREPYGNTEPSLLDRELLALAALAEAHRDEFEAYVEGLEQTTSLAAARARKNRR